MASYKDWMNIEKPNDLTESDLREAVKSMGRAANKRLKRMAERNINYDEDGGTGPEYTAGVRRFSVRGKDREALNREFVRVRNFLSAKRSSLSGMWKMYKEFVGERTKYKSINKERWGDFQEWDNMTKSEKRDYNKMVKQKESSKRDRRRYGNRSRWEELRDWNRTWSIYNRLRNEQIISPDYPSGQIIDMISWVVYNNQNLTDDELFDMMNERLNNMYEEHKAEENRQTAEDRSTSSFFNMGPSD